MSPQDPIERNASEWSPQIVSNRFWPSSQVRVAYEVTERWADGRPWVVIFKMNVVVAGVPCRQGEAAFGGNGELIGATLSHEWSFGPRRFGAGSVFRYYTARDERLNDVTLCSDQEVDGLPCLGGTKVWFHRNQRVSSLRLASDHDVDSIPCASGENLLLALNFHRNGRLARAVLARDHVLVGREFRRGTHVSLDEKGRLAGVTLREDRDIDGITVQTGAPELKFHENGRLGELILARDHVVAGK